MEISWITNNKMKKLLERVATHQQQQEVIIRDEMLKELLTPSLKKVRDCIIISEKSIDRLEEAFDKALQMYMDKTGYEASNTETRINSYFENDISMELGTKIALMVLEVWGLRLKEKEPESKFCLIMCSDENCVEVRFHKIHEGEKMWLDENLENYSDGAIGYAII